MRCGLPAAGRYFDYKADLNGYAADTPHVCIDCPADGALCADPKIVEHSIQGLRYNEMEIALGWWQDPEFLEGKSNAEMKELVRFEWCGFRDFSNGTHFWEGSLCLGGCVACTVLVRIEVLRF